ncbi:hypothetical protein L249_0220 [Ophiocordyceps polyrhachis-furcata BCC 54312]|uniref:Uncharacterized protein n=1 Tax=Ophiocordyceps polyrhachis-furcata BCC 54312 TaxID=1330021 RepID=A0A367LFA3_9HYPO|nr:hypothetical protein L249_0220 [Ophiocordyceps polyrhachis-furcata BCC 54312]
MPQGASAFPLGPRMATMARHITKPSLLFLWFATPEQESRWFRENEAVEKLPLPILYHHPINIAIKPPALYTPRQDPCPSLIPDYDKEKLNKGLLLARFRFLTNSHHPSIKFLFKNVIAWNPYVPEAPDETTIHQPRPCFDHVFFRQLGVRVLQHVENYACFAILLPRCEGIIGSGTP